MTADDLITSLGLQAHPEGGHYIETFRDDASTAIYFLLKRGETSRWHRVLHASEGWHFYGGEPLELSISRDGRTTQTIVLSPERPQFIVQKATWQSARSLGAYSLVGCTVAPPFAFEKFQLAPPGWSPG